MRRIVSFVDHQSSANLLLRYYYSHFPNIPLGGDLPGDTAQWGVFSHLEETGVLSCVVPDFKGRSIPERLRALAAAREAWFRLAEEVGAPTWALPDLFRVHLVRPLPKPVPGESQVRPFFVDLSPEGLGLDQKLQQWFEAVMTEKASPNHRPEGLEAHTDLLLPVLFRSNSDEIQAREWVLLAEVLRRVSEDVGLVLYVKGMGESVPGGLRFEGGRCYKAAFEAPGAAVPIQFDAQDLPLALDPDVAWDVVDHPAQYGNSAWVQSLEALLRGRSQALAWKRADPWNEVASDLVPSLLGGLDLKATAAEKALEATKRGSTHWQLVTEPMIRLVEGGESASNTLAIRLPEVLLALVLHGQGQPLDLSSCYPQTLDYIPLSGPKEMIGSPIPSDQMSQDGNWVLIFSQGGGSELLRARKGNGGTPEQPVSIEGRIHHHKRMGQCRHLPPSNRHWNLVRQGVVGLS